MSVCLIVDEGRVGVGIICDPLSSQARFHVIVDDQRHEALAHRASLTVHHDGGVPFVLFGLRALTRAGAWQETGYRAHVDYDELQRVSLVIHHPGGSLFVVQNIRATARVQHQQEVG